MPADSARPMRKELIGGLAIAFILFAIAPFWLLGEYGGQAHHLETNLPGATDQHSDDSIIDGPLNDVCPVSGEKIGSMGDPVIQHYQGQEVRLCCRGCISRFEKTPAKFMSQLLPKTTGQHTEMMQQAVSCPFLQGRADSMDASKTGSCCGS